MEWNGTDSSRWEGNYVEGDGEWCMAGILLRLRGAIC
jgi:hypothetical protein